MPACRIRTEPAHRTSGGAADGAREQSFRAVAWLLTSTYAPISWVGKYVRDVFRHWLPLALTVATEIGLVLALVGRTTAPAWVWWTPLVVGTHIAAAAAYRDKREARRSITAGQAVVLRRNLLIYTKELRHELDVIDREAAKQPEASLDQNTIDHLFAHCYQITDGIGEYDVDAAQALREAMQRVTKDHVGGSRGYIEFFPGRQPAAALVVRQLRQWLAAADEIIEVLEPPGGFVQPRSSRRWGGTSG